MSKLKVACLLLAGTLIAGAVSLSTASASGYTLYALAGGYYKGGQIMVADDATGTFTRVGDVVLQDFNVTAMAYNGGYLWIVAGGGGSNSGDMNLYRVPVSALRTGAELKGDPAEFVRTIATNSFEYVQEATFKPGKKQLYVQNENGFFKAGLKGGLKYASNSWAPTRGGRSLAFDNKGRLWGLQGRDKDGSDDDLPKMMLIDRKTGAEKKRWYLEGVGGECGFCRPRAATFHPGTGGLIAYMANEWSNDQAPDGLVWVSTGKDKGMVTYIKKNPVTYGKIESLTYAE